MKTRYKILLTTVLSSCLTYSCSDEFLDRQPLGAISEAQLTSAKGVEGSLIQAYRTLNGRNVGNWYASPWNWVWGSVRSEEAYKGSEPNDQGNQLNPIEKYEVLPNSESVLRKWNAIYDGIGMANITLNLLARTEEGISDADRTKIEAEARFLRGFHHFEAKRNFNKVPYVDETVEDFRSVPNDTDIYPQIEADLEFAYNNLPDTQEQIGRVNRWAAASFLAKVKLYQNKFAEAKALFDVIIAEGMTSSGEKYGLLDQYSQVFRGENENSKEIIFGVQVTVGDGTGGQNALADAELTNPHNDGPVGCCGFFQPTQTLANSFRTDAGLPVANPHASPVLQHESSPSGFPDRGSFDPRIDHTIGRVGIQFLDWGPAKASWIRHLPNGGPFLPKKHIHTEAENGTYQIPGGWGQGQSGRNILLMRYSDLLLMAAEAEIEAGTIAKAQEYVNMVRARAANPVDFVKTDAGVLEANYNIAQYTTPWSDADMARSAVRLERMLELAMEGHRFYDLVRWQIAEPVLDAYLAREAPIRTHLDKVDFKAPEDYYLPIPEYVVNQSGGTITP